jgi:nucleoside-diphosphate-sugar epimerase
MPTTTSTIAGPDDLILVTGSNGFIGSHVVESLLSDGFTNLRCLVRSRANRCERLFATIARFSEARVEVMEGNLRSRADCAAAVRNVRVVLHLAAGIEKSFAGCVANSVVTTRNLLDAVCDARELKRFVNVSSLAVYSNFELRRRALLDETCAVERDHVGRNEPYVYAKLKQDEVVLEYAATRGVPVVIVRPGAVYGPGKRDFTARVGMNTFGFFMHLGGGNRIPFTHVENCARAIVLAGVTDRVDGEVFNIIDDQLPTSREFMRAYRRRVEPMRYVPVPYPMFYLFCAAWERYARWSGGQLPEAFNRRKCAAYWKGNQYSNDKAKRLLGWIPQIPTKDGLAGYLQSMRTEQSA